MIPSPIWLQGSLAPTCMRIRRATTQKDIHFGRASGLFPCIYEKSNEVSQSSGLERSWSNCGCLHSIYSSLVLSKTTSSMGN
jgi:hypothetical protein